MHKVSNIIVPDYEWSFYIKNVSKDENDEYISKFLPDYPQGQLPEKIVFHCIICSIYPEQMFQIVYETQMKGAILNKKNRDDKVEITIK